MCVLTLLMSNYLLAFYFFINSSRISLHNKILWWIILLKFSPTVCCIKLIALYLCPSSLGRVQFSSVQSLSCVRLCDPMNRSTPGFPVHHQLLEFTQTHVHRVSDAIQPSCPLLSPSPPAPNPSQHQSLFQWVNSSHQVAKVLEFQL